MVFQSTHPHGVRLIVKTSIIDRSDVSIHAPTRGATCFSSIYSRCVYSFNPRTHTGCDGNDLKLTNFGFAVSIHAPTRGATTNIRKRWPIWFSFNPRTHTGCDDHVLVIILQRLVSIHAPTRGATLRISELLDLKPHVSIHAPTRGATSKEMIKSAWPFGFQSTHPHGVRLSIATLLAQHHQGFNPRTHTGCDLHHTELYNSP